MSCLERKPEVQVKLSKEERKILASLRKYYRIVPEAWNKYLAKLKGGEYHIPLNEHEMRCFVFSECLDLMRKRGYDKPYEIFVEDKEILEGKRADLAVGWLEDARFVAVEFKRFPEIEEAREDIVKLHQAVESKATCGFFLMLADAQYRYHENLDLKALGIEEDGQYSWFNWEIIKPKHYDVLLEALIVSFFATEKVRRACL